MIFALGLNFLGVFRIAFLDRQMRHQGPGVARGPPGGFLLGLASAVGWPPRLGPVPGTLLAAASAEDPGGDAAGGTPAEDRLAKMLARSKAAREKKAG